jgi:hypothetical protein
MAAKPYRWEEANDRYLRVVRHISFDEIVDALTEGPFEIRENSSRRHPDQQVYVVRIKGYPWVVPFEETPDAIVLKTAFPNRRLKTQE